MCSVDASIMLIYCKTFAIFVEILFIWKLHVKHYPLSILKNSVVEILEINSLCILKRYCLVAIIDLLWQLLFGWRYNFRFYGLKRGKKELFQLFKVYIFVKVAIYETNLMHNEKIVTQVHTIVINCPNTSV